MNFPDFLFLFTLSMAFIGYQVQCTCTICAVEFVELGSNIFWSIESNLFKLVMYDAGYKSKLI